MHPRRVLVVDDELSQRQTFCRFLSRRGFEAIAVPSGLDALTKARAIRPHLALIDISMPQMDGIQLLKFIRQDVSIPPMPVILMTGLSIPGSILSAAAESLGAGAIYIKCQNFSNLELRIESELAQSEPRSTGILRRGGLVVDPHRGQAWFNGRSIHIGGHRFHLLCILMRNTGPMCRRALLKEIWPARDNPNIVDVNILRLRQALKSCSSIRIEVSMAGYYIRVATAFV